MAGDEASGNVVPSTDWNMFPRGEIGRDTITSNSAGTTTTEVILSETVTIDGADRQVQIFVTVTIRSNIAGGAQCRIDVDGTQVQRKNTDVLNAGTDLFITTFASVQMDAGDHLVEVITGVSGADGNTVTAIANGTTGTHGVCMFVANDVGPAYP